MCHIIPSSHRHTIIAFVNLDFEAALYRKSRTWCRQDFQVSIQSLRISESLVLERVIPWKFWTRSVAWSCVTVAMHQLSKESIYIHIYTYTYTYTIIGIINAIELQNIILLVLWASGFFFLEYDSPSRRIYVGIALCYIYILICEALQWSEDHHSRATYKNQP